MCDEGKTTLARGRTHDNTDGTIRHTIYFIYFVQLT
jgi:hypothetical protein